MADADFRFFPKERQEKEDEEAEEEEVGRGEGEEEEEEGEEEALRIGRELAKGEDAGRDVLPKAEPFKNGAVKALLNGLSLLTEGEDVDSEAGPRN